MTNAVYLKTLAKPNSYTYSYYQNDHLGTPQQLLSFNSATVWQGEYDAFGEISITNNQIPQPLRFAGQYHDSESNLYYNWHRYYNPKLGRYISSDPIGLDGGMNRFGYAVQNPIIYYDRLGLASCGHYPVGHALRWICKNSPGDENNLECVRKCLKVLLPPDDNTPSICSDWDWYFFGHPYCWTECEWVPWKRGWL